MKNSFQVKHWFLLRWALNQKSYPVRVASRWKGGGVGGVYLSEEENEAASLPRLALGVADMKVISVAGK